MGEFRSNLCRFDKYFGNHTGKLAIGTKPGLTGMSLAKESYQRTEMFQIGTAQQGKPISPMPYDRTRSTPDDTAAPAEQPAGRALVPVANLERRSRRRWYRWAPDPIFITHLIAEAQQVPQARRTRRGSMADAQAAYRPHQTSAQDIGGRTRQVV
jgi:hypothetical protein